MEGMSPFCGFFERKTWLLAPQKVIGLFSRESYCCSRCLTIAGWILIAIRKRSWTLKTTSQIGETKTMFTLFCLRFNGLGWNYYFHLFPLSIQYWECKREIPPWKMDNLFGFTSDLFLSICMPQQVQWFVMCLYKSSLNIRPWWIKPQITMVSFLRTS